jgi:hypothetical protein
MMEDDAEMRLRVRLDYRELIDDLNSKFIDDLMTEFIKIFF